MTECKCYITRLGVAVAEVIAAVGELPTDEQRAALDCAAELLGLDATCDDDAEAVTVEGVPRP